MTTATQQTDSAATMADRFAWRRWADGAHEALFGTAALSVSVGASPPPLDGALSLEARWTADQPSVFVSVRGEPDADLAAHDPVAARLAWRARLIESFCAAVPGTWIGAVERRHAPTGRVLMTRDDNRTAAWIFGEAVLPGPVGLRQGERCELDVRLEGAPRDAVGVWAPSDDRWVGDVSIGGRPIASFEGRPTGENLRLTLLPWRSPAQSLEPAPSVRLDGLVVSADVPGQVDVAVRAAGANADTTARVAVVTDGARLGLRLAEGATLTISPAAGRNAATASSLDVDDAQRGLSASRASRQQTRAANLGPEAGGAARTATTARRRRPAPPLAADDATQTSPRQRDDEATPERPSAPATRPQGDERAIDQEPDQRATAVRTADDPTVRLERTPLGGPTSSDSSS